MKKLTNFVKKENLNLVELMMIKGAAKGSPWGCDTVACNHISCVNITSKPSCTSAQCSTAIDREKEIYQL